VRVTGGIDNKLREKVAGRTHAGQVGQKRKGL